MKDSIKAILTSSFLRTLEVDPSLRVADSIERLLKGWPDIDLLTSDLKTVTQYLTEIGENLRQRAVINPYWLSKAHGVQFHFYLVSAEPGWLRHLVDQIKALETGISHYILYGAWDSLLVLHGTDDEATELLEGIQSIAYYDLTHFSSHNARLFRRYKTTITKEPIEPLDFEIINKLVMRYDTPDLESIREELERSNVICGPAWVLDLPSLPRISAYVGITLKRGSHALQPDEVLEALLKDDVLKTCLVDLFEIDKGYPFHYFARLVCSDMDELDKATNAIGFTRIGRVGLDGNTLIVADEKDDFPTLRSKRAVSFAPSVDLAHIDRVANQMLRRLGVDSITAFNNQDGTTQLIVLRSLDELYQQASRRSWDNEREKSIQSAIDVFARSSLEQPEGVRMAGAVMVLATDVEGFVKHALRRIVEAVYGRDYGRAQRELKLPTKDFRKISLGKAVSALRTIKNHGDFAFLTLVLEDDWLVRLEGFANSRNTWAHGGVSTTLSGEIVIDEARRILVEGIELIRWIGCSVIPALMDAPPIGCETVEISLPERRDEREPGVFISHSTSDRNIAERIAIGVKTFGYKVFYAEWGIDPPESIVAKIEEALAKTDTLLILLSPNAVNSRWVKKELSSTLMRQLSGQNVRVVPILLADCDIPALLSDIQYIDMRDDFEAGFIKLLGVLRQRIKVP